MLHGSVSLLIGGAAAVVAIGVGLSGPSVSPVQPPVPPAVATTEGGGAAVNGGAEGGGAASEAGREGRHRMDRAGARLRLGDPGGVGGTR